jgi:uncharacterized protein YjbJ (UPF0337 family)
MNKDIIKGDWNEIKGSVQKKWGKLTNNDLDQINGDRNELAGKIQKVYGLQRDEAEKQLKAWEDKNREDRTAA